MVTNKHITAIVAVITTIAVVLCFLAIGYSDKLNEKLGGGGVTQEYEYRLFNTNEPIEIDIRMDQDEWDTMLANASAEVYYVCDVVINGQKLYNVAIRPKGNTSLSAIAMDPNNNRYSFKLEFDQYVNGQTCYGLDKLILNNNYADATNMKEAIIYDMFQYLGADASLYNYAVISVNGEYWGVYLALEAVEDSFMLRNYGTQDGEMYKPDTLDMGGGDEDREAPEDSEGREAFENEGAEDGESSGGSEGGRQEAAEGASEGDAAAPAAEAAPADGQEATPVEEAPADEVAPTEEAAPEAKVVEAETPAAEETPAEDATADTPVEEAAPAAEGESTGDWGDGEWPAADAEGDSNGESDGEEWADRGDSEGGEWEGGDFGGGGFGNNGGGANLNYIDDDLDSYYEIWNSEITGTTDSDHRRVVTALKNISEGNELEKYMDIDNLVRFMAAHVFSVNSDSLSGNMSHNYYLYEYEGQLNMIPWDYNLALGGMGMGGSNASDTINDPIDTPWSGTKFFDTLMADEEYLEQYHEYLRKLVEYVKDGAFDETYNRIRNQIDELVETDPNAMYTYDQYLEAAELLYKVINLRADSIEGQLDGTIPSTNAGQRQDSSNLVDASGINLSDMGSFSMGGMGGFGDNEGDSDGESGGGEAAEDGGSSGGRSSRNQEAAPDADETTVDAEGESTDDWAAANADADSAGGQPVAEAPAEIPTEAAIEESAEDVTAPAEQPAEGETVAEAAAEQPAEGESAAEAPAEAAEGDSTGEWAANGEDGDSSGDSSGDRASGWGGFGGTSVKETRNNNIIIYAVCMGIVICAVIGAAVFKRRR